MKSNNPLIDKSYLFSIHTVQLYQRLVKEYQNFPLFKQLVRSATSIGANAEEAQGGQSKRDFAAKLYISYKEARETHYWLRLLSDTGYIKREEATSLLRDCEELLKILTAILKSTKRN